jgi:hypothetical protein
MTQPLLSTTFPGLLTFPGPLPCPPPFPVHNAFKAAAPAPLPCCTAVLCTNQPSCFHSLQPPCVNTRPCPIPSDMPAPPPPLPHTIPLPPTHLMTIDLHSSLYLSMPIANTSSRDLMPARGGGGGEGGRHRDIQRAYTNRGVAIRALQTLAVAPQLCVCASHASQPTPQGVLAPYTRE